MQKHGIILLLALFVAALANAQEFGIKKIELTPEGIVLHYDLTDTTRLRKYTINVYSSVNNFTAPLRYVNGDAGIEVAPGFDRRITWDSRKELGTAFHGEITLEIRGNAYVPFIKFDSFKEGRVIKRATKVLLTWSGGSRQNILNIAIYKGDQLAAIIPNIANSGNHELLVPAGLKPGKDYFLEVSDSKNKDQIMRTPVFEIRRRIPLAFKAGAVAVIGVVAATVISKSGADYIESPPPLPGSN
jgi:hypothetical protein